MTGVPGVRLRGVQLALDAIGKTEALIRSEAEKLAAVLGHDAPIVLRARGHAAYLRNVVGMVSDDIASAIEARSATDSEAGVAEGESATGEAGDAKP